MPRRAAPKPGHNGGYKPLPIDESVPTGMPYGEREAAVDSVRANPLPEVVRPSFDQVEQEAIAAPTPGPGLFAPSERGDEPFHAGLDRGPGPGSDALGFPQVGRIASYLRRLAQLSGDPALASLAAEADAQRM